MSALVLSLLCSLALTLLIEVPLAALLRVRGKDLVLIGAVNCLTNPLVNYLFWWALALFPPGAAQPYLILAALELAVWLGEALLFRLLLDYRRLSPFLLSLLLNAASCAAGLLITLARGMIK